MIPARCAVRPLSCCERIALVTLALPLLGSCAAHPLDRPELRDVRDKTPTLNRSVLLTIDATAALPYGSKAEWREDFERAFRELRVASDFSTSTLEDEARFDLVVDITLEPTTPAEPKVLTQGALLDFLAWITIPLVSLWIEDVETDSGLHYRLRGSWPVAGKSDESRVGGPWDDQTLSAAKLPTCLLDRYALVSWHTLGALFVPPFIFSKSDPEHLPGATGARVRAEVAFQAAAIVKKSNLYQGELLEELGLTSTKGTPLLAFKAAAGLRRLRISAEFPGKPRQAPLVINLPLENDGKPLPPIPLTQILGPNGSAQPCLIRIEALGATGPPLSYTIAVPSNFVPATRGE